MTDMDVGPEGFTTPKSPDNGSECGAAFGILRTDL